MSMIRAIAVVILLALAGTASAQIQTPALFKSAR
jgi:hypothetical protein